MRIADKKKFELRNILEGYEKYRGCLFLEYNNFVKSIDSKLNKEDKTELNNLINIFIDKILDVFANSTKVRVEFSCNFEEFDSDDFSKIFDDLD